MLEKSLGHLSPELQRVAFETLGFQDRSLGALLALLGTSRAISDYEEKMTNLGDVTGEVARNQLTSLSSAITLVWHRMQDLLLSIGEGLSPYVRKLAKELGGLTEQMASSNIETGYINASIKTAVDMMKAFGLGVVAVYTLLKSLGILIGSFLALAFEGLKLSVGAVIDLFLSFGRIASTLIQTLYDLGKSTNLVAQMMFAFVLGDFKQVTELADQFSKNSLATLKSAWKELKDEVNRGNDELWEAHRKAFASGMAIISEMVNSVKEEWKGLAALALKMFPAFPPVLDGIAKLEEVVVSAGDKAKKTLGELIPMAEKTRWTLESVIKALDRMGVPKDALQGELLLGGHGMQGLMDPGVFQANRLTNEITQAEAALETLREIGESEVQLTEEVLQRKELAHKLYSDRLRELKQAESVFILQTAGGMFEDMAEMAATFAGRQSAVYLAMFAVSKAFAIATATLKIMQAAAESMADPTALTAAQKFANYAMIISQLGVIVSSISSVALSFGGGRARGGPVSAGEAYLVGERGPELFAPGMDGGIIPNNRLGGSAVRVVINNYTDAHPTVTERMEDGEQIIEVAVKRVKNELAGEFRNGTGDVNRALEQSFKLRRGR